MCAGRCRNNRCILPCVQCEEYWDTPDALEGSVGRIFAKKLCFSCRLNIEGLDKIYGDGEAELKRRMANPVSPGPCMVKIVCFVDGNPSSGALQARICTWGLGRHYEGATMALLVPEIHHADHERMGKKGWQHAVNCTHDYQREAGVMVCLCQEGAVKP